MRILLISLLLSICLAGPVVAQTDVVATPNLKAVGLQAEFTKLYPLTIDVLKTEFTDDYAYLVSGIAGIKWAGGQSRVALLNAFGLLTEIRRKYADKLLFAPSEDHAVVLGLLADFYTAVFKGEGPEVCGRFAQDGSGVLFELDLSGTYAKELDLQTAAYLSAVVHAIERPEYNGVAVAGDWGAVLGTMVAAGAPQSFVKTISAGDGKDPDLCPALAAMFRTSGLLDTPEGKRTRADFAKNLVGY